MEQKKKPRIPRHAALTRYARMLKFGDIHTKIDSSIGLHAIIAVHNTKLGPAIGGCRFYPYASPELALKDVLRLSYGMTLKAAGCGLPHGGAKAVIIKPKGDFDRDAIFRSFGDFVQELNGRYITAIDVGSTLDDMKIISERTPYVCSISPTGEIEKDPSISTALGVFRAIQAAVKFKLKRDNCNGIRVAIQGVGHVGFMLAQHLKNDGAIVTISDLHQPAVDRCVKALGVQSVPHDQIEKIDCDIYSPCALGGTITHDFILETKAKIIAGAANNQLAHHNNSRLMQDRGIIYLPDFLINSGGLIHVAATYGTKNESVADEKVNHIYDATMTML
jgi:leucine dehydrogenase